MLPDFPRRVLPRLVTLLKRFIRNTGGNTVPEYALIIAILAAGACIAYIAAGSQAQSILSSTSRLTDELAGGPMGTFRTRDSLEQAEHPAPRSGHALRHSSWFLQHSAVIIGSIAWVATMTVGLLGLRVFRSMSNSRTDDKTLLEVSSSGTEPTFYDRLTEKRQQICRLVTRDVENTGSIQACVRHLMSKRVTTVRPNTLVSEAQEMMTSMGIRHLLVCDEHGQLIGIVSDRDVKNRQGNTVQDIMTPDPAVAQPDVPIGQAITLMLQRNISCLPVVDEGQLCGVLTTTDIMLSCQCMMHVLESTSIGQSANGPTAQTTAAPSAH